VSLLVLILSGVAIVQTPVDIFPKLAQHPGGRNLQPGQSSALPPQ
jgi:hypothetical protein